MVGFVFCLGTVLFNNIIQDADSLPHCFVHEVLNATNRTNETAVFVREDEDNTVLDFQIVGNGGLGSTLSSVAVPLICVCMYVLVMTMMCHIRGIHAKHFNVCYDLTLNARSMTAEFQRMSGYHGGIELGRG